MVVGAFRKLRDAVRGDGIGRDFGMEAILEPKSLLGLYTA